MATDRIRVYTDGASRGNPGPAAIGVVICDDGDAVLQEHREALGEATNNEAEYRAVHRGLKLAATHTKDEVVLTTDSELVIRQLNGRYRVQNERLHDLLASVREEERAFAKVVYRHAPRMTGHLARADELANEALNGR